MLPIAEENHCERSGLPSQLSWRRHLSLSEPRMQHVPVNTQTNLAEQQPAGTETWANDR